MAVMPITEEDALSDEDEAYQEEVLKFLDSVNKKHKTVTYNDKSLEQPG